MGHGHSKKKDDHRIYGDHSHHGTVAGAMMTQMTVEQSMKVANGEMTAYEADEENLKAGVPCDKDGMPGGCVMHFAQPDGDETGETGKKLLEANERAQRFSAGRDTKEDRVAIAQNVCPFTGKLKDVGCGMMYSGIDATEVGVGSFVPGVGTLARLGRAAAMQTAGQHEAVGHEVAMAAVDAAVDVASVALPGAGKALYSGAKAASKSMGSAVSHVAADAVAHTAEKAAADAALHASLDAGVKEGEHLVMKEAEEAVVHLAPGRVTKAVEHEALHGTEKTVEKVAEKEGEEFTYKSYAWKAAKHGGQWAAKHPRTVLAGAGLGALGIDAAVQSHRANHCKESGDCSAVEQRNIWRASHDPIGNALKSTCSVATLGGVLGSCEWAKYVSPVLLAFGVSFFPFSDSGLVRVGTGAAVGGGYYVWKEGVFMNFEQDDTEPDMAPPDHVHMETNSDD